MSMDFNGKDEDRSFDVMPDGTVAPVHMSLRPGGAGSGNWLKRSKAGNSLALDAEFTVLEGQYAKRKFWGLFTLQWCGEGEMPESYKKAIDISKSKLRQVINSARALNPDDDSDAACAQRSVEFDV